MRIVGKETVTVKKLFFALTAVACCGVFTAAAEAQYQQPYGRPAQPQYTQPQQARGPYQAQRPAYGMQQPAYGVQQTAMRPSTSTYAATPASGSMALKPINPPSAATQRILMASRNQPTPAPAQVGGAAPNNQARSNVRLPASPAAAAWGPPPSGGYDAGAYGGSQFGGQQYGGQQYGGQMGAAPVAAQPDGNYDGGGAAPCNGGQCGGDSCGFGGCCRLGLGCCLGRCGGCFSHCCGCLGNGCCLRTTGDLVQHTPFFGTTHGYYYFRPYHVMHVFSQQELATRWGADPRNTYDNTIFQRTYEQLGVDMATIKAREEAAAKAKAAGLAEPATAVPAYSLPSDAMPTPLPGGYQGNAPYNTAPYGAPAYGAPMPHPPQGPGFQGSYQGGMIPQGAMPNVPAPSIEYVPNR